MARPAIDTLSTYYRTLEAPAKKEKGSSLILSALTMNGPEKVQFETLRRATAMAPLELAETLRSLQDLELVTIRHVDNDDEVALTPKGKRMLDVPAVE
jgi:DNA-binding HxlR family transcriptional regulator